MLFQLGNTLFCLSHTTFTLKEERCCYDTYGKNSHFLCYFGNDRSRTRTGTAAHTCGNKYHIGIAEQFCDLVTAFLGSLFAYFGFGACALSVGNLLTYLHLLSSL